MNSVAVQVFTCLAILFNAIVIGLKTDYQELSIWNQLEVCFLAIFFVELVVRMVCWGLREFFNPESSDFRWNVFDFVIISIGVIDVLLDILRRLDLLNGVGGARVSTILRLAKLLRILRVFRIVRFMKQLYLLAFGFIEAVGAVFWITILMLSTIYVLSILLVRTLGRTTEENPHHALFAQKYPDIPTAMISLFELMSSPNLAEYQPAVLDCPLYGCFLVLFIVLGSWGMIALLTGVVQHSMFVDNQIRIEEDRMDKEAKRQALVEDCTKVFYQGQGNDDGELTVEQVGTLLPLVQELFQKQHIQYDQYDLDNVATVMDSDASGLISKEEFIHGILGIADGMHALSIQEIFLNLSVVRAGVRRCESYIQEVKEQHESASSSRELIVDRLTTLERQGQLSAQAIGHDRKEKLHAATERKVTEEILERLDCGVREVAAVQGQVSIGMQRCEAAAAELRGLAATFHGDAQQLVARLAEAPLGRRCHESGDQAMLPLSGAPCTDTEQCHMPRELASVVSEASPPPNSTADGQWCLAEAMLGQMRKLAESQVSLQGEGLARCEVATQEMSSLVAEITIQVSMPPAAEKLPEASTLSHLESAGGEVLLPIQQTTHSSGRASAVEGEEAKSPMPELPGRAGKEVVAMPFAPTGLGMPTTPPQKVGDMFAQDAEATLQTEVAGMIAELEASVQKVMRSWPARLVARGGCGSQTAAKVGTCGAQRQHEVGTTPEAALKVSGVVCPARSRSV